MADDFGLNSILFGGDSGGGAPSTQGFNLSGIEAPSGISPQGFNLGTYGGGSADINLPSAPPAPDSGGGGWWGNLMGGLGKAVDPLTSIARGIGPVAGLATAGLGTANSIMGMQQGGK